MKNVMKRAWEIARDGQRKFGGKVKEYFAIALKLAWEEVKKAVEKVQLKGTERQVAWAEAIRTAVINRIEECFNEGLKWFEAREASNERIAERKTDGLKQYKEIQNLLYTVDDAEYWIDNWQANYKKDWKIYEGVAEIFKDDYRSFFSVFNKGDK